MRRPRATTAALIAALVLPLSLSACTSVRNGLGTRDGICFSSLPTAREVVGAAPSFEGVRYMSAAQLISSIRHTERQKVTPPPAFRAMDDRATCLFAYRGTFPKAVESSAWHLEKGPYRYAVVLVRQSDHAVLGVVLLAKSPLRFTHFS